MAYVLLTGDDGRVRKRVHTFSTMTADLLALSDWLDILGVTQIVMEPWMGGQVEQQAGPAPSLLMSDVARRAVPSRCQIGCTPSPTSSRHDLGR
ncbi:MAG: hypothetical protein M3Q65_04730 [Chloroflexota bacterium]|nr:hypothetical protein [Chloroflexota bacterium]